MESEWRIFLWTTLSVGLTLSVFSFLYKDNPFYRFTESLYVGIATGYMTIILWYTGLLPTLIDRIWIGQPWWQFWGGKWWYIFPGILGLMMWFRFSKKKAWLSRYPIAFYIGISMGAAIPLEMKNRVNEQLFNTFISPDFSAMAGGFWNGISEIIIIIGVLTGLFYFFFSVPHKGVFGTVAKVGIYTLMIGFGASFGYTVMGRISLFIQRVQTIRDWASTGIEGGGGMSAIVWIFVLFIVLLVLIEMIRHMRKKPTEAV
ncbi:MAG: hypothetical protein KAR42_02380 [candidate division Zixibacteria bacterium]|nr:hypothetical protein [candidate division Zixibacteria bacterium]